MAMDGKPVHIIDHIFIGDRNAAKARGLLKQHNINYILNCTPDRDTDPVAGCPSFFEKDPTMTYKVTKYVISRHATYLLRGNRLFD